MYDFQKADMWKRISAWLFDFILIGIVTVGVAWILSVAFRYDTHLERLEDSYEKYGLNFSMTAEEQENLTEEELEKYREAAEQLQNDPQVRGCYTVVVNLVLTITALSIIISHAAMEFVIPLILGNGQTLGKKIFGIGVMRADGVRLTPFVLFVRSILGKCTLETLVPVFVIIMIVLGITGIVGIAILLALLLSQIVLLCATKARTPMHDMLSQTVTVDIASQMIFDTPEELLAYKQKLHKEMVDSTES